MFGQPRCREWSPLATQQLRLRTLLQIVGYNMYGNDGGCCQPGSLYYTLHSTTMSAPFYTSEKLLSVHPKWREIDSEYIHKMSSLNVVVRVWKHVRHEDKTVTENNVTLVRHEQTDKIIQTWGVHFSGLMHIGANLNLDFSAKSFKENTLIFQMSGGYFCSYDKIKPQALPKRLQTHALNAKKELSPSKVIPIDNKRKHIKEHKSVSPNKGSYKSDSEVRLVSRSNSPPRNEIIRRNKVTNERFCYDDDSVYEHSPKSDTAFEIREYSGSSEGGSDERLKANSLSASNRDLTSIEESEAAENFDMNQPPIPKYRYLNMKFLASEIRPSYNAEKLQRLHELQFSIKNRLEAVQEIKEKIYQKSAMENNENLSPPDSCVDYESFSRSENLSISCREYSLLMGKTKHKCKLFADEEVKYFSSKSAEEVKESKKNTNQSSNVDEKSTATDRRFTIQLNKLLEFRAQPSPSQRLRHAFLTRQVELGRFKKRLLKDERDSALGKIRRWREVHSKFVEENQDNNTDLMQKYHSLSKKWDQLKELRKSEAALRELCKRSSNLLQARRWSLVQDIQIIYPIAENSEGKLCILDVHLPPCQSAVDGLRQIPETTLAVALGRVSHVAAMAASLLSVPLRHPLRLMGSRTKVVDHLASQHNEIPLFARNKNSMFQYGLYLLNRNIAQLLWATHRVITPDPRDTLTNLRRLVTPPQSTTDLDTSKTFGSASSVETTGGYGYSLTHPLSVPALNISTSNSLHCISSSPSNLSSTGTGAVHKNSQHNLRSLIAVGTDRTGNNIIASGGFNNTGNRQFNRFKDSVDGHSPKAAMVIRKHRCSHSVGSYVDEQSLSLELSSTTIVGSEPSLLIHGRHCEVQLSDDVSDSPSENVENALSFSESDLTKVSDLTSPETNEGRVVFCVGDDEQTPDGEKHTNRTVSSRKSLEESPSSLPVSQNKQSNEIQQHITEIENLQLNVDQLSKELQQICSNYSHETMNVTPSKDEGNLESAKINSNDDGFVLNVRKSECCSLNSNKCGCIADIEALESSLPPYCSQPCSQDCLNIFEKLKENPDAANIEAENNDDIMHDVIVLPSAEAVLTSGSHFANSLDLDEVTIEENESSVSECANVNKTDNDEFLTCSKSFSLDEVNSIKSDTNVKSESVNSSDEKINDRVLICEGDTASRDANELLQSIRLIEETQSLKDLPQNTNDQEENQRS